MLDLTQFDTSAKSEEGVEMPLVLPNGDKVDGASIRVIGRDSKDYQDKSHKLSTRRIREATKSSGSGLQSEDLQADGLELAVTATKGWTGLSDGGQPLEYSADNARKIYTKYPWLREQVAAFVTDRANFLGN